MCSNGHETAKKYVFGAFYDVPVIFASVPSVFFAHQNFIDFVVFWRFIGKISLPYVFAVVPFFS